MTPEDKYYRSLHYWTMGEKYLHVARVVAEQVVAHKNKFVIISSKKLEGAELAKQLDRKTRWSDINVVEPLLFDFYHGLELMLKGFSLLHVDQIDNMDHQLSVLYRDFITYYSREADLIIMLRRYLLVDYMPEMLKEFFSANQVTVDRYHEVLRYPCPRRREKKFDHLMLKYRSIRGLPFYRQMICDIRLCMMGMLALSRQ